MNAAVIYWSSTGNTEMMAKELANAAGIPCLEMASTSADEALSYDILCLGSPAMGDEELEEDEVQPFMDSIESGLAGKRVALFGSYDWGDGEWMRLWYDRCKDAGAVMIQEEGLIANLEPDDEALAALRDLAGSLE